MYIYFRYILNTVFNIHLKNKTLKNKFKLFNNINFYFLNYYNKYY